MRENHFYTLVWRVAAPALRVRYRAYQGRVRPNLPFEFERGGTEEWRSGEFVFAIVQVDIILLRLHGEGHIALRMRGDLSCRAMVAGRVLVGLEHLRVPLDPQGAVALAHCAFVGAVANPIDTLGIGACVIGPELAVAPVWIIGELINEPLPKLL